MAHQKFLRPLIGLTLALILLVVLSGYYPPLASYQDIFSISIFFFVAFSVLTYWLADSAAHSSNKFAFTQATFLFLFGKLLFSVLILVVYKLVALPETNLYVLPFFLVYLCYTILETGFMMRLGRISGRQSEK
ncbi:MAG: Zn-dependent protease with chaperone function [Polaribacter sp.]|jgi:hypothetical protein